MAKRKKNRTHKLKPNANPSTQPSPKSFIIKSTPAHHTSSNKNGIKSDSYNSTSLNLLVKDFRKVMEPNTASNLKERKSNRFKDFLAMAGPLGVTHMIVFSQSLTRSKSINQENLKDEEIISSINLKIYKVPRGPTLSLKVLRYSLMIDILNADKSPRSPGQEFKTEPLLIMNNFNPTPTTTPDEANQLNLLTTTFRNLFPQIKIQEIQLIQTRRIVLLSYNPITKTIDFRHYLITIKPIGVSKNIRKLMEGSIIHTKSNSNRSNKKRKRVLDLSGVEDLAEYVLGQSSINKVKGPSSIASSGGFTSAQSELENTSLKEDSEIDFDGVSSGAEDESENEINENKIDLPQHYLGKGNLKNSKKSIKLKELGPRLELGLVKIEQGLGNGDVLFHEFIKKTKEEEVEIKKMIKEKEKLRLSRKAEQDENVKKKKLALEAKKEMKADKRKDKKEAGEEEEEDDEEEEEEEEEEAEGEGEEGEEGSEIDENAEYSDLFDDDDLSDVQASGSSEEESEEDEEDEEDEVVRNKKKKTLRFTKS